MIDQEAIFKIFEKVLSNKDAARMALKNPGKVLSQHGLAISDEDMFNSIFFDISPKIRAHLVAASGGKPHGDLLGCDSPRCIACQTGMAAAITAAITACIVCSDGACLEVICEYTGLSRAAVIVILETSGTSVSQVIRDLCKAMGAC